MIKNPLTIIGGVVSLVFLIIVCAVAFDMSGSGLSEGQKNLALLTILGLVGNAIPSLLALLKSEDTQHDLRNGVVKQKVKEAIVEVASDTDTAGVYTDPVSGVMTDTSKEAGDNDNGRQGS